jgi:hypothetical protein
MHLKTLKTTVKQGDPACAGHLGSCFLNIGVVMANALKKSVGKSGMLLAAAGGVATSLFVGGSTASAAVIAWGTPQTLTGPANISTNGTFVHAIRPGIAALGAGLTNVYGDTTFTYFTATNWTGTFGPGGAATTTPSSATGTDGFFSVEIGGGAPAPAFTSNNYGPGTAFTTVGPSSASYSDLLKSSTVSDGTGGTNNGHLVTLGGSSLTLTLGTTYEVQAWVYINDGQNRANILSGSPTGSLLSGSSVTEHGQYIIGTFTADATTQQFTINRDSVVLNNYTVLTALSLRAVPEPAALSLMGLAGIGLRGRGRHQAV